MSSRASYFVVHCTRLVVICLALKTASSSVGGDRSSQSGVSSIVMLAVVYSAECTMRRRRRRCLRRFASMFFTGADPLCRTLFLLTVFIFSLLPITDSCYVFPSDKPDPCTLLTCPPGAKCVIQSSPTPDDADAKTATCQCPTK